jgi:N4-gp56 family major capsid protein
MPGTQVTTQGSLSPEIKTFYDRTLLERALPTLVHAQFAQRRPLGRAQGKTIEFRKFTPLTVDASLTALTEGVTPAGNDLNATAITAAINQYGDFIQGSDLLDLTAIDPVLTETAELLGEQAGLWIDRVIREVLMAGTTVQRVGGGAARVNIGAANILTVTEIRRAIRTLKANNIKGVAGTRGSDYVAFVHPRTIYDLQSDTAWRNPHEYQDTEAIYNGEIGRLYGCRFIESTEAKVFAAAGAGAPAADIYATLVLGADAYGIIPLEGGDLDFIFKPIGASGTADPLNQRWTSCWKTSFAARVLNDAAMVRIEHAVSA